MTLAFARRRRDGATRGEQRGYHGGLSRGRKGGSPRELSRGQSREMPRQTPATNWGDKTEGQGWHLRTLRGCAARRKHQLDVGVEPPGTSVAAGARYLLAGQRRAQHSGARRGRQSTRCEVWTHGLRRALRCLRSARRGMHARGGCADHAGGAARAHGRGRALTCAVPWGRPWCRRPAVCGPL